MLYTNLLSSHSYRVVADLLGHRRSATLDNLRPETQYRLVMTASVNGSLLGTSPVIFFHTPPTSEALRLEGSCSAGLGAVTPPTSTLVTSVSCSCPGKLFKPAYKGAQRVYMKAYTRSVLLINEKVSPVIVSENSSSVRLKIKPTV